jgi:signal peptidase II
MEDEHKDTPKAPETTNVSTPSEAKSSQIPLKKEHEPFVWTWKSAFYSFVWLGVLMFGIDLLSKWLVVFNLGVNTGNQIEVIPGFFYLWPLTNLGSAYGAGDNIYWMRYVYIVISWAASILIPYYWYKQLYKHDNLMNSVFMLCFAGAIGNAIDRTFYWPNITGFSGVVDFLSIRLGNWVPFGSFNIADACLVVGCVMAAVTLLVRAIKGEKEEGK